MQTWLPYIIDAVLIVVGIIFIIAGSKQGLLRSVVKLVSLFVSVGAAAYLSPLVSNWFFTSMVRPRLIIKFGDKLKELASSGATSVDKFISSLPSVVQSFVKGSSDVSSFVSGHMPAESSAEAIVDKMIAPVILFLMKAILFLVIFLIVMILFRLLYKALGIVDHIPVIGKINSILGAVIGIAEGVLVIYVLSLLISTVAVLISPHVSWLSPQTVNRSLIISTCLSLGTIPLPDISAIASTVTSFFTFR